MRALFPEASADTDNTDDVDIHDRYAEGWLPHGGIRANFVCSADGAAQAAGTSAGLQTPGDNRVFAALRDLADVVLVGAGTAIAEGYAPISLSERRRSIRRRFDLAETLPTAVTSRSLRLDPDAELFRGGDGPRTIVVTCASAPAEMRERLSDQCDVAICGDDEVEPAAMRAALAERGFTRVLSEGGPTAFAQLAAGGVIDELCLSVSPTLIGPGPGRVSAGTEWPDPVGMELASVLTEDGALFLRYRFRGATA